MHRGEIVKKVIDESGYTVSWLAGKINRARSQLYVDFQNPLLSIDVILSIGKAIKHDFSKEFREIPFNPIAAQENAPGYSTAYQQCRDELVEAQRKLIQAMNELEEYRRTFGSLPTS
ncbi:hypothetical protein HER32_06810 [Hymenobacter sp. BT18]|uniref:hypothetical protein n=1 Tax=Hymenobacter sp. BT18 TaxID=2835648 RepID=UPI00143E1928|nr:hypothetical protein [Hymenobacter sp. BT18]QIX60904.1 hypothetical protein HER32_06810 [Hymenobacter sp. BT18]